DLDFEFVLFASAMIDYDYIMELISRCMGQPAKWKMTKDELINLIRSSANLLDDRDDIIAYIDSLDGVNGRTEQQIKEGYEVFKAEKYAKELSAVARKHGLETDAIMLFVNDIVERRIFDGEKLNELLEPLDLGWRDRTRKETELMNDLVPLLKRLVPGQEISGLKAYEE
ncbi:MAG: type I restriction endonuclease subunit R, partial [Salinivirgaceae bacterium]|nr:type I restriction endonuclease subunit R [Salinivirgaceae bacterium]